ncbi:hypothetical protein ABDK00_001555 [Niabella insulamsoli]|uniref:hypothetical protein n=1 Tax=Niabella insulamsoli TaxID=3144874 RepID=UPI0031FDFE51
MNEQVKKMEAEKAMLQERINKLNTAIQALQEVCDHNYLYQGHDSHYEYYECTDCGHAFKK